MNQQPPPNSQQRPHTDVKYMWHQDEVYIRLQDVEPLLIARFQEMMGRIGGNFQALKNHALKTKSRIVTPQAGGPIPPPPGR